jgi:hypothetical protein
MKIITLLLVMASWQAPAPGFRNAEPNEFAGEWEFTSDDGTSGEQVELAISGRTIRGSVTHLSRGYFSRRTTVDYQLQVIGNFSGGGFELDMRDPNDGWTGKGTLRLRGEFLVLLRGENEIGWYARPGQSLIASAEDSREALVLARALQGHVYATGRQASGRGAFVGGRTRLALCADGSIAFDKSDVASAPGTAPNTGVDMGSSIARRGRWSIVLRAGAPVVRAEWEGTGTSYSLTAYFNVRPSGDGRSALVDGVSLPVADRC